MATNCNGKTNAQLVSGDTITVNVTVLDTSSGYDTVLTDVTGDTFLSAISKASTVGNVPTTYTHTLNQTPASGAIYVFDGTNTVAVTCPVVSAVPTMSEWAMILMGLVLAGGAALYVQRRRNDLA